MQRIKSSLTHFSLKLVLCLREVKALSCILLAALFYTLPSASAADLTQEDLEPFCNNTTIWENKTVTGGQTITPEQCMAVAIPCAAEIAEQEEDTTPSINLLYGCVFSALGIQLPSVDEDISSGN
ncbi:hypothetical protein [Vibrio porteresiae]|uniref:Uncharacterized protein n=1 Tax=Vibrio porteresiae DSM 19223 TaxID=1123496 RepID=A0ABZ0Q8E6_9VIBR|nr:hypothetical protein [Vibrio porteresiae]WPC72718.1 hypothetical protein R8Z52_11325 [Vibrio porteresiae DSM 19223]